MKDQEQEAQRKRDQEAQRKRDFFNNNQQLKNALTAEPSEAYSSYLSHWKYLCPLNIGTIVSKSEVAMKSVDVDGIEFKRVDHGGYISIGFHKKGTNQPHGVCRRVHKGYGIYEGMFLDGSLNGYGRMVYDYGNLTGMWKNDVFQK